MTDNEQREAARQFYYNWKDCTDEKGHYQLFWLNLLQDVLGMTNANQRIEFEKRVIVNGQTKFIDAYIPESHVLIEQKKKEISLSKSLPQSGGKDMTPYQQAKQYADNLPFDEKVRWIVLSNFSEIRIHDMNSKEPEKDYITIPLRDIQTEYYRLNFLLQEENKIATKEENISFEAGEKIGQIYDALLEQYDDKDKPKSAQSLNKLCVRLVFCMYAEDAGVFEKHLMFHDYMEQIDHKKWRDALIELFKVLNTPYEQRDPYMDEDLAAFPYVNGGLFADADDEEFLLPWFTDDIISLILDNGCRFDWSRISPTIFGALFESTLDPEIRKNGGMHYTSIENIHKVIDPLFLSGLNEELENIKAIKPISERKAKAKQFQKKLSELTFLDPACGSGNFLTETYICLRRLENQVIDILTGGQITMGNAISLIQVSIDQFYGIEINDFAVSVSRAALWIAEHQMLRETEDIVKMPLEFLPLKPYNNIIQANALTMPWEDVISPNKLSYIMGNPPFYGARRMTTAQKDEIKLCFSNKKGVGNLDYVAGWFQKASEYIAKNKKIKVALVATNSITQGEQPPLLWKDLFNKGISIDYAYRTFRWDSEANIKAQVHCVIIGFSYGKTNNPIIYDGSNAIAAKNINAYLMDVANIFIESRTKPICAVDEMIFGNMPNDDKGKLSKFTREQVDECIKLYPESQPLFKQFMGADEFIYGTERYCLWLKDADPHLIQNIPPVMQAIRAVKTARENSPRKTTRELASSPELFGEIRQPDSYYLLIPRHSSEKRTYIPIGYMSPDIICGDSNMMIPKATLYEFGVMTSNVHMAWVKAICGRIKSDYRYSNTIVYNNFPWPNPTDSQKKEIEITAQMILAARDNHPNSTLYDLYSEDMYLYKDLKDAHIKNDTAVMRAYGFNIKTTDYVTCVTALMNMYENLTK